MKRSNGFTLLEIVIVVAIIAFVASIAIPKLGGRKNQMRAVVRKIGVLTREIKYNSKLQNATFRMAFRVVDKDARDADGNGVKSEFWIEKAPGSVVLGQDMSEEELQDLVDEQDSEEAKSPKPATAFVMDTRILKKPETLPDGMRFDRIEIAKLGKPVTSGVAYIYFLPEGYVDEAAIHLTADEKLHWTVAIAPLTGRADVLDGDVPLDDLRSK